MFKVGFRGWLRQQRDREDPVGDFARDLAEDSCAKNLRSFESIKNHVRESHQPSYEAMAAVRRAELEWEAHSSA